MKKVLLFFIILVCLPISVDAKCYYFKSYHLYTCEEDKYDPSGLQYTDAVVDINEVKKIIRLSLYDTGERKWYSFNFKIEEKMEVDQFKKNVDAYLVTNNVNEKSYVFLDHNVEGLYIDINYFSLGGVNVNCWMSGAYKVQ